MNLGSLQHLSRITVEHRLDSITKADRLIITSSLALSQAFDSAR